MKGNISIPIRVIEEVDPILMELIDFHTTALNNCDDCQNHHTPVGTVGLDSTKIQLVWTLCDYHQRYDNIIRSRKYDLIYHRYPMTKSIF